MVGTGLGTICGAKWMIPSEHPSSTLRATGRYTGTSYTYVFSYNMLDGVHVGEHVTGTLVQVIRTCFRTICSIDRVHVGEHVTGTLVQVIRTSFHTICNVQWHGSQPLNRKTMPHETQHQMLLGH
jgi:hypothetical protein